ncbi:MAG TPA: hypothetical protein VI653_22730 [Steroidobacteraceae bacterium]
MVVNSVSTGLSPSHGLRSGDSAQTTRSAALAKDLPRRSFAAEVDAALDASVSKGDATDVGQIQSTLERARRQAEAAEKQAGSTPEPPGGRPTPGIALYERISQYNNGDPPSSTLLRSWNQIMQRGPDTEGAAAAFAKALSQNETLGLKSGILDLTA